MSMDLRDEPFRDAERTALALEDLAGEVRRYHRARYEIDATAGTPVEVIDGRRLVEHIPSGAARYVVIVDVRGVRA